MTEVEKPVAAEMLTPGKAQVALDEPIDMEMDTGADDGDEDLYTRLKTLQRQLEFYEIQVTVWDELCVVIFQRG